MSAYHVPVLPEASLRGLNIRKDGIYVDATFGGGGHSRAILNVLGDTGRLIGIDRDSDATRNLPEDNRLKLIRTDYRHIARFLKAEGITTVDGILADLGVSSHQLDAPERGFSFRSDEALDMRMDTRQERTAEMVVNDYTAEELQRIFSRFGEVRNARTLAQAVVGARPIRTTGALRDVVAAQAFGPEHKYLARVFQAIRIEVNGELDSLRDFLEQCAGLIRKGGRLVVISYHSLEDRLVKNYMKHGVFEGEPVKDLFGRYERPFRPVTRKPVRPAEEEIEQNPRARSARLRIAEKL